MEVRVDGVLVGTALVTSTSWASYDFAVGALPVGHRTIAIRYTNDAVDRDLDVDKATLYLPVEAEHAYATTGTTTATATTRSLAEGASFEHALHTNTTGLYRYEVTARSTPGLDAAPHLQLFVDGVPAPNLAKLTSPAFQTYTFIGPPLAAGRHSIRVAYLDDPQSASTRLAEVDRLTITPAPTGA
jgi:hypothetical protein